MSMPATGRRPLPMPYSTGMCAYCPPAEAAKPKRLWRVQQFAGHHRMICSDCLYLAIRETRQS